MELQYTTLNGHIDFYGWDVHTHGWCVCGWSSSWPSDDNELKVSVHFADGHRVTGTHFVKFYSRTDIAAIGGTGFIVFLEASLEHNAKWHLLAIVNGMELASISATPNLAPL